MLARLALGIICLALLSPFAHSREPWKRAYESLSEMDSERIEVGHVYRVSINDLRPTQFSVGKAEIRQRFKGISKMDKDELRQYLKKRIGTVVVGPGGEFWLLDGHHLANAIAMVGGEEILVNVVKNWSALDKQTFYRRMVKGKMMWLYDENGRGPLSPARLPRHVGELKDDPYRSFAYRVRKASGYRDLSVHFQEFIWANFFREYFPISKVRRLSAATLREGLLLAHSAEAKSLPGYTRGLSQCEALLRGDPIETD